MTSDLRTIILKSATYIHIKHLYFLTDSPSVTNATILLNAPNAFGYSITVICAIHLNSRADQCVAMAMADGRATITGTYVKIHAYIHTYIYTYVCT